VKPELISDCVHCGFCLPTCPTYVLWREEMDSPRGRIDLMDGLVREALPLSATVVEHFDRCLGCMACVTACPSGVRYDGLIESTRAHVESRFRRDVGDRLLRRAIFSVLPHRRRLAVSLALAPVGRALPLRGRVRALSELAPRRRSSAWPPARTTPSSSPQLGTKEAPRVGLLAGCVQSVVFGHVNVATARVLAADGYEVACPRGQGCCGALSVHGGRLEEGRAFARRTVDTFERYDLVVTNAAGCGSNLKDYGQLLADDPGYAERAAAFSAKVRDVSELLADPLAQRAERHPLELRVAFQDSCHLRHAQRITAEPRAALAAIPGVVLLEPAEQELCCGSAGIYNIVQPEAARALGDRKAAHVLATEPDVYASANPGCLVQLSAALARAGARIPAVHPVELVDASIRGLAAGDVIGEAPRR
jgi:glycolate dehydrogenase iron-sulfur subunit